MLSERVDFLLESLAMHIGFGKTPAAAWDAAVEDYVEVYHSKDERTILQRAATVALRRMEEDDAARSQNEK